MPSVKALDERRSLQPHEAGVLSTSASGSNLDRLTRGGLQNFHPGMTGANLFFKPLARGGFTMAEQHRAWRDFADELEQFVTIRVGGEVEIQNLAAASDFARARAEDERFPGREALSRPPGVSGSA
jgi:hypothetical protein